MVPQEGEVQRELKVSLVLGELRDNVEKSEIQDRLVHREHKDLKEN